MNITPEVTTARAEHAEAVAAKAAAWRSVETSTPRGKRTAERIFAMIEHEPTRTQAVVERAVRAANPGATEAEIMAESMRAA